MTDLVRFARSRSAYYRESFRRLPAEESDLARLPIASRSVLMAHFDEWVTDPAVKKADIDVFLRDRTHIGERFLDRYVVWKSSGTTGEPGVYVQDADALTTFDALLSIHLQPGGRAVLCAWNFVASGGRAALVVATGDHFASIASWRRLCDSGSGIAARSFSVLEPMPVLVAALNAYRPAYLASYPSMLSLLAAEQEAGRLRIAPFRVWSGGEHLGGSALAAIEAAFSCPVVNEYGASECLSIGYGCAEGWIHIHADWVVLEPVDAEFQPTPPGEASHTVLLTNLANRVQPIIRYDLGDSVLASPEPCRCGSPLPAVRVEGRRDDIVSLVARDGHVVRLLPLALTTIVEDAADVRRFQIVQTAGDQLRVRLDLRPCDRQAASLAVGKALRKYLAYQSLSNVHVGFDRHAPVADPRTGKLKEVVVAPTAGDMPAFPREVPKMRPVA